MSKVKIQGNASGTGVVTLTAPNTNTDRTITLPDSTGSILDSTSTLDATKLSGALPAIDGSALTNMSGGGAFTSTQIFKTSGTWNWAAAGSPSAVYVTLVGGGGGGGGCASNGTNGGSGGGGATTFQTVSVTGNVTVTVGSGGAGSPNYYTAASAGGTSTFGAASASGGGGGVDGYSGGAGGAGGSSGTFVGYAGGSAAGAQGTCIFVGLGKGAIGRKTSAGEGGGYTGSAGFIIVTAVA
jgi:hypothetical protein